MSTTIFIIIIVIVAGNYLLEQLLAVLNLRESKKAIPAELSDLYTTEKRNRQREYQRTNIRFGTVTNTIGVAFSLFMICLGFAWLNNGLLSVTDHPLWHTLLFIAVYIALETLIELPASIYDTFKIETRFGFNTTTPKTFLKDTVISLLLSLLLQGVLMSVLVLGYMWQPDWLWLIAWVVVSIFMIFLNMFYPQLIVPLFNKQTPLPEGELREAIEKFAERVGFSIENIYVMDSSKRSTKANAYFTGFGKKKRIVLFDTLIKQLTTDEIVAVLAHEIGHQKHNHTIKALLSSLTKMLLLFVLLGIIIRYDVFALAIGCEPTFVAKFIVFMMLYQPVTVLLSIISNIASRRHEYEADEFAKQNNMQTQLVSALKKMTVNDLGNPTPHPFTVFLTYSHPTLSERIRHLETKE